MKDHNNLRPALSFSAGEHLADELAARGWSRNQFAEIIGHSAHSVNAIIRGKKTIAPEVARDLAAALGTSPQLWLNLDNNYRLWASETSESERRAKSIARRAAKAGNAEQLSKST